MTDEQLLLDKLSARGIKPTAMRLLILRTMMHTSQAVSLLDLVDMLETADKSTVSRTLSLFLSHHLVHSRRVCQLRHTYGQRRAEICSLQQHLHV